MGGWGAQGARAVHREPPAGSQRTTSRIPEDPHLDQVFSEWLLSAGHLSGDMTDKQALLTH